VQQGKEKGREKEMDLPEEINPLPERAFHHKGGKKTGTAQE